MDIITRKDARRLFLRRYFTGKPCGRGHLSERSTDTSVCDECNRENSEARYAKMKPDKQVQERYSEEIRGEGGPWNAEQAIKAGLAWFVVEPWLPCGDGHATVRLDGVTCNRCGVVDVGRMLA